MSVTRRTFIQQAFSVGSAMFYFWIETKTSFAMVQDQCTLPPFENAVRLIPNEPKVVTRYSTLEMNTAGMAGKLAKFREAICKIRALPATDLIGWDKEIAQHCLHCKGPRGPASNNIHYSSAFLPWHRAYLYFMERILRKLSGDNDLRLIYWNWENSQSRLVPGIYAPQNQCLYWANRHLTTALTNQQVDVKPLLAIPDFPTFGGGAQGNSGAAYGGPHANVHNAFAPGDMANLMYSPRDPVFYAHHGNIDRLWSSWARQPGHKNPDFGSDKAYFYDENRKLRYIEFNDLKDETKLGYRYSSYMSPTVAVGRLKSFAVAGKEALFNMAPEAITRMAHTKGPRYLLIRNIQNLEKLPGTRTFGIFADKPPAGADSATDKGFLGTVATILAEEADHHEESGPLTAALDVTDKLPAMVTLKKLTLELTVAPLDAAGKTTAAGIPLAAESISFIG
jgi:hypothetical protein